MPALFDLHVVVDWSAAASPRRGKDSLWMAIHHADGRLETENLRTRLDLEARLAALFEEALAAGKRVLAGFDFPFGYPAGAAAVIAPERPDWRGVWAHLGGALEEGPRNRNNRMAVAAALNARFGPGPERGPGSGQIPGPFWGCHARAVAPTLSPRKTPFPYGGWLAETRAVDARVRAVSSCWQLAYAGSVGGQALTGIAALERLRHRPGLRGHVAVWPFETGLAPPEGGGWCGGSGGGGGGGVVLAEVYPSLVARAVAAHQAPGEVKDRAQVRLLATGYAALDRAGRLAALFAGPPEGLAPPTVAAVVAEEAWILGAGHAEVLAGALAAPGAPA